MWDIPEEALDSQVIKQALYYDADKRDVYSGTNPTISSDALNKAINSIRAKQNFSRYEGLDDDIAISEIVDPDERQNAEIKRMPLTVNSSKNSIRSMPLQDIEELVKYVATMKKGAKYAEQFSSMTSEQISDYISYSPEVNVEVAKLAQVDPQYGIDYYEKRRVLEYLKVEELVSKIPEKIFEERKRKFEGMRNNPGETYELSINEKKAFVNSILDGGIKEVELNNLNLVTIAEAFEARETELQIPKKVGIFARIKAFFNRRKQPSLPEPKKGTGQNKRNDLLESIKSDPVYRSTTPEQSNISQERYTDRDDGGISH